MGEVDFRDGSRGVPEHVEELLRGVDTYKLTFSEAMQVVNRRMENEYIQKQANKMLDNHFRFLKGGRP